MDLSYGGTAYRYVSKMTGLRRLDIEVKEEHWNEQKRLAMAGMLSWTKKKYYKPLIREHPSFKALRR